MNTKQSPRLSVDEKCERCTVHVARCTGLNLAPALHITVVRVRPNINYSFTSYFGNLVNQGTCVYTIVFGICYENIINDVYSSAVVVTGQGASQY